MTGLLEGTIVPVRTGKEPDPGDPPIFLLQASPAFAGGILPDGAYQRVPVGATGQVLTVNADGSVGWSNSSSGFSNPMTASQDIIVGGTGGTPTRLAVGSNGQVLTVSGGLLAYAAALGFANPMTTTQDLIVGGASGAAGRLGVGANGQVLTVTSGNVGWANSAAGFVNPMTTLGDIITGGTGGAAQRLGIGSSNQVLGVSGGAPTWINSPSGFANPMTTAGDMITATTGGAAVRVPGALANGYVLTWFLGGPAWAPNTGNAVAVVLPSNDTTGVQDQANITGAWTSGVVANGGEVLLGPGEFYVKPPSGNNCLVPPVQTHAQAHGSTLPGFPVSIRGCGAATVVYPVGAGVTGIYYHRTSSYGGQYALPAQPMTGYLRDFTIDGSLATGASTGLDWGDGWGYHFDLNVVNFTGTGAVGVRQINRVFWTEKNGPCVFRLSNNTTALYITTNLAPGGDHSSEYNTYYVTMFAQANQQGVVVDGVNMGGSHLWLQGNMSTSNGSGAAPPGNIAALSIINAAGVTATDGKRWYEGSIWIKCEANPGNGTGTTNPYLMFSDGAGYVRLCSGAIFDSQLTTSVWNGAEFSFDGLIGDTGLASAWPTVAFPGLGTAWNNKGPNALVAVAGGTVTGISVNGQASGLTQGLFPVNAGGSLTVSGSVAPTTFNVLPAALPNGYSGF